MALTVPTAVPLALSSATVAVKSTPASGVLSLTGVTRTVTSTVSLLVPSETSTVSVATRSVPSS